MLLLVALMGCTPDPEPVAIEACQTVPTLSVFKEDLAIFQPYLLSHELDLLKSAEPTSGLLAVKSDGLAHLRANATCVVHESRPGGDRWELRMQRTIPAVQLDGSFGDPIEQDIDWVVVKTPEGLKVESGLQRAVDLRAQAAEAQASRNYSKVLEIWRTIMGVYGDPTLVYDVAYAQDEARLHDYRTKLLLPLKEAKDEQTGELVVPLVNNGPVGVKMAKIDAVFVIGEDEHLVEYTLEDLASSQRTEVRVALPEGDEVKYRGLRVRTVELAE